MRLFQAAHNTPLDSPFSATLSVHGLHFTVCAPSSLSQIVVTYFFPSPSRHPLLVFADSSTTPRNLVVGMPRKCPADNFGGKSQGHPGRPKFSIHPHRRARKISPKFSCIKFWAQTLKNFKILKFSSEIANFKGGTHQTPFLWGILKVRIVIFKRD